MIKTVEYLRILCMKEDFDLTIYKTKQWRSCYGHIGFDKKEKIKDIKNAFQTNIISPDDNKFIRISTKISWLFWFPVIDCDSNDWGFGYTKKLLEWFYYDYILIESSPNKYWFIIDHKATRYKCIKIMKKFPKNDTQFIDFCKSNKYVGIRAFPKDGFIPKIIECTGKSTEILRFHSLIKIWFNNLEKGAK